MTRYHINFEGKVYPCKAKIYKCPYGEEFHSDNKIELYYKLMNAIGVDTTPSENALKEQKQTGRIKSLFSSSSDIAKVDYPVDIVVATLKDALTHLEDPKTKETIEQWKKFEAESIEDIRLAFLNGEEYFPPFVPEYIVKQGRVNFVHWDKAKVLPVWTEKETKVRVQRIRKRINERAPHYENFMYQKDRGLNHKNYESTYAWTVHDFEKFSHDLNTSKMVTQPMFYGSIDRAKTTISNMDNYELLAVYDDYSVTDKEIEKNVKEANYFKYTHRDDLTEEANKSLETWYNRNAEIYKNWKLNTPKRVLLSMEIAKELDKRGVLRQDNAHGKELREE